MDAPDPADVLGALGLDDATDVAPLPGGWDNHLWSFRTASGEPRVLRLYRLKGAPDAAWRTADNEAAALQAATQAGIPAPRVLERGSFAGAPVLILELLPGEQLAQVVQRNPRLARALGRQMGHLQARLHQVRPEGVRQAGESGWERRIDDAAVREAAIAELVDGDRLCHFDFHPFNVLASSSGVTGVVDFANAATGDPRADLGMTWVTLLEAPLPRGTAGRAAGVIRRRLATGWEEGYREEAGEFPLTPLARALGLAIYVHEFGQAAAEGRGWATERDVARLRRRLEQVKGEAGLAGGDFSA